MKTDSDETLWQRAVAGEHSAFGVVFERHARRIQNHCFRRIANWAVAEDLMSVVFLEAWRKRDGVHFINGSSLPWLLGVATNICRNNRRSLSRYDAALSRLSECDSLNAELEADEVVNRLHSEQQAKWVLQQLSQLNKDDQTVIQLSVWDGLAYDEIAIALNIPVGTVRSRLSRARARLKANTTLDLQVEEEVS